MKRRRGREGQEAPAAQKVRSRHVRPRLSNSSSTCPRFRTAFAFVQDLRTGTCLGEILVTPLIQLIVDYSARRLVTGHFGTNRIATFDIDALPPSLAKTWPMNGIPWRIAGASHQDLGDGRMLVQMISDHGTCWYSASGCTDTDIWTVHSPSMPALFSGTKLRPMVWPSRKFAPTRCFRLADAQFVGDALVYVLPDDRGIGWYHKWSALRSTYGSTVQQWPPDHTVQRYSLPSERSDRQHLTAEPTESLQSDDEFWHTRAVTEILSDREDCLSWSINPSCILDYRYLLFRSWGAYRLLDLHTVPYRAVPVRCLTPDWSHWDWLRVASQKDIQTDKTTDTLQSYRLVQWYQPTPRLVVISRFQSDAPVKNGYSLITETQLDLSIDSDLTVCVLSESARIVVITWASNHARRSSDQFYWRVRVWTHEQRRFESDQLIGIPDLPLTMDTVSLASATCYRLAQTHTLLICWEGWLIALEWNCHEKQFVEHGRIVFASPSTSRLHRILCTSTCFH